MNFLHSLTAALTPLGLLWTAVIFTVTVFLHELAHYALARWQGVKVQSFSIGMGPVLFKWLWRGTQWRISALPLGGYVEIDGMAPEETSPGHFSSPTRGFAALPTWGKVAILLAGPLTNLLLALGLMTANFAAQGVAVPQRALIGEVRSGSTAQKLGLQAGDVITAADGRAFPETYLSGADGERSRPVPGYQLVAETLKKAGRHRFTVEHAGQVREVDFDWQPTVKGQKQLLGIAYGPDVRAVGVGTAFTTSVQTIWEAVPQIVQSFLGVFKKFFTLDLSQDQNVSGPIGTAEVISRAAAISPWALVQIATLLNLSLAFFNLFPIPGLDGGRILLVLVGALRGRPLSFQQEQAINFAGFALVMGLSLFVLLRDVSRFF